MFCFKRVFMIAATVVIIGSSAAIAAPKISDKMVKNGDAQIEYLVQGHGPVIVLPGIAADCAVLGRHRFELRHRKAYVRRGCILHFRRVRRSCLE